MTEAIMPLAPYRVSLEAVLKDAGRLEEAQSVYRCVCGRDVPAGSFVDVRDQPGLFGASQFVCKTCASDLERREAAEHERLCREATAAAGQFDAEALNDRRARRDFALIASDWTQLADNRERIGAEKTALWDAYRADLRAWFSTVRDEGSEGPFPLPPV